jgi:hypothetical protein
MRCSTSFARHAAEANSRPAADFAAYCLRSVDAVFPAMLYSSLHSRQCVGRTSMYCFVLAPTHPPCARRQANARACGPSRSMTASSRSRSNGAVSIGCHCIIESAAPLSRALDRNRTTAVAEQRTVITALRRRCSAGSSGFRRRRSPPRCWKSEYGSCN